MNDMLVVIREAKILFFLICDHSKSQSNVFSVKTYSPKTDEVSGADPGGVARVASHPPSEKPTIKVWSQTSDNL